MGKFRSILCGGQLSRRRFASGPTRPSISIASGLALLFFGAAAADAGARGEVRYSASPDAVIVTLAESPGELAGPDAGPRLEVRGDGLLVVVYPEHMKRAGTYTTRLSHDEMRTLLDSLLARGLAEFDSRSVKRQKHQSQKNMQKGTAAAPLLYSSDPQTVHLDLRLEHWVSGDGRKTARDVDRSISWTGLREDAERHPEIESLQNLSAAVRELRKLRDRDDLVDLDRDARTED